MSIDRLKPVKVEIFDIMQSVICEEISHMVIVRVILNMIAISLSYNGVISGKLEELSFIPQFFFNP